MKRHKIFRPFLIAVLAVLALLLTGCPGGGDPADDYRGGDRSEYVANYPVAYSGTVSVAFPNDIGTEIKTCSSSGTYEFSVQADNKCYLNVSAEWFYTDPVTTNCTASGSIEGFYIVGHVNRAEQVCSFGSCNDGAFPAEGSIKYTARGLFSGQAICKGASGKLDVPITVHAGQMKK